MKRGLWIVALLALFGASGCASYTEETREIRDLYQSEAYRKALDNLEASGLKDEDKNRLLYRLEKAMILDRLTQRDPSRKLLIEADKIADQLYTTSVSRTTPVLTSTSARRAPAGTRSRIATVESSDQNVSAVNPAKASGVSVPPANGMVTHPWSPPDV